jgi:DNA modification methylase
MDMVARPYFQDESVLIYHGDCQEILPTIRDVDLVLTDPPYGIGEAAGKNKSRRSAALPKDYAVATWDNERIDDNLLSLVLRAGRNCILFGGNYYTDILPQNQCWLIWDKENSGDFADAEIAWTTLPGAIRLIRFMWNGMLQRIKQTRYHPTQKPVEVMRWCIQQADIKLKSKQNTIIDPFMGSGTTLRAAKDLGRKAIGIEREERYCEIAARRMAQSVLPF